MKKIKIVYPTGEVFRGVINTPEPYLDHAGRRYIFTGEIRYPEPGEYYQNQVFDNFVVRSELPCSYTFKRKIMKPLSEVDDSLRYWDYDMVTGLCGTVYQKIKFLDFLTKLLYN